MKKSLLVTAAVFCMGQAAYALEFQAIGNGSLGLGGAGVARTHNAMASWWNPAGLAFADKNATVSVAAGAGIITAKKLIGDIDSLATAYDSWQGDQLNPAKLNELATVFNGIDMHDNLIANANGGLATQIGSFGIGGYATFEGGALPALVAFDINSPLTVQDSLTESKLKIKGIVLGEAPLSYGHRFSLGGFGDLGIGLTGKVLYGEVTAADVPLLSGNEIVSADDLVDQLTENRHGSFNWGVDAGAVWKSGKLLPLPLSLGVVGKNLNSPSFRANDDVTKVTVDPQFRAGASLELGSWIELTADIDLVANKTIIDGVESQRLGGGIEIHPLDFLKLRAGAYRDLANNAEALTGGATIGTPWIFLDIDGAYGLEKLRFDGKDYPAEGRLQVSANFAF